MSACDLLSMNIFIDKSSDLVQGGWRCGFEDKANERATCVAANESYSHKVAKTDLSIRALSNQTMWKSQITNHKSQITNHKSQITNHKSQITNHKSQITNHNIFSDNNQFLPIQRKLNY
jgi:hypothetical protein